MSTLCRRAAGLLMLMLSGSNLGAAPPALVPGHPESYQVQTGDTLWDISGRFLQQPWRWREIWQANPQINNPDLIYPGDVIALSYVDGQPRLSVERSPSAGRTVKLSPGIRREALPSAIPAIPISAVRQFLSPQMVEDVEELQKAPYIVDFADEHIAGGSNDRIWARAIEAPESTPFVVVREGKPYKDPDTGEILGHEATYIGKAILERPGDPAVLRLDRTRLEAQLGDKLVPDTYGFILEAFHPKPPSRPVQGRIISVLNGLSQIGQYHTVVINLGQREGIEAGDVFTVHQGGGSARDRVKGNISYVQPLDESGVMMIYRVFDKVSFGLIMRATRAIHVMDKVFSPET